MLHGAKAMAAPRRAPVADRAARPAARPETQFLDLMRWFAALAVVLSHVRSLTLADYAEIRPPPSIALRLFYFAAGFGHEAVVVFFVISGFLVGGASLIAATEGRLSLLDYAVHRFARIYIVLGPALLIGLLLDQVGSRLVDDTGLYTHLGSFRFLSIAFPVTDRLDLGIVLGNLAMLQTILVPPLGSNGPLWSLASEWWYYVLFGLAVVIARRGDDRRRLAGAAVFAIALWALPIEISLWFALWALGVGVALLSRHWRGWPAPVGLAAFVLSLVLARLVQRVESPAGNPGGITLQFALDLMIAVGFSLALLCARRGWWGRGALNRQLAAFSYTIYLVHFPAMVFLAACAHRVFGFGIADQPTLAAVAFTLAMILCLYGFAWGVAQLTEAHTSQARNWLYRTLRTATQRLPRIALTPRRQPLVDTRR